MTARRLDRSTARPKKSKRKKVNPIILVLCLMGLFVAAYFLIALIPVFQIDGIDVTGTRLLSSDEIIRVANVPKGHSILLTNFAVEKKRVMQIPIIKSVSFSRMLPSRVLIRVEERKEAVVCVLKDKQSLILDKDGVVLNPSDYSQSSAAFPDITGLPVMNGLEDSWLDRGRFVRADVGRDVLKLLSEFESFIVPQKLQIDVSDTSNIKLIVDDVLIVKIGLARDLKQKMDRFESIYSKIKDRKNSIEYVDVSSLDFPVVKFR